MEKNQILKRLEEINSRKKDLKNKTNETNSIPELRSINAELDTLNTEVDQLNGELKNIESRSNPGVLEGVAGMAPPIGIKIESRSAQDMNGRSFNPIATYTMNNANNNINQRGDNLMNNEELQAIYEKRGQDLKEKRSVNFDMRELRSITIASSNLVIPTQTSNTLNPAFNEVSSLLDLVKSVPLMGGESYKKGFVVGYGEGDYTTEGSNYSDADPIMDYVNIGKAKITAYCEMSEETIKLPNVDYQTEVAKNINIAIRKKISKQIIAGLGGDNQIKGIFNAPTNVIPADSDLSISEIDADTLDKIVFGYGGDEDVEGAAYLILNKADLAKFAAIRTSTGEKLYKIVLNGNTGTISSSDSFQVPFIINSACSALSATGTAANTYCMAYGKVLAYEMPIFSPVEVTESRDFKFKEGMICYKGAVWCGGNTAMYKGFTRIKKSN